MRVETEKRRYAFPKQARVGSSDSASRTSDHFLGEYSAPSSFLTLTLTTYLLRQGIPSHAFTPIHTLHSPGEEHNRYREVFDTETTPPQRLPCLPNEHRHSHGLVI